MPPAVEAGKDLAAQVTLPAKDGAKPTETPPGWSHGEDIAFRYTQY